MNRTDRLLAIMLELQSRRYTRAEDLAAQFSEKPGLRSTETCAILGNG